MVSLVTSFPKVRLACASDKATKQCGQRMRWGFCSKRRVVARRSHSGNADALSQRGSKERVLRDLTGNVARLF